MNDVLANAQLLESLPGANSWEVIYPPPDDEPTDPADKMFTRATRGLIRLELRKRRWQLFCRLAILAAAVAIIGGAAYGGWRVSQHASFRDFLDKLDWRGDSPAPGEK